MPTAPHPDAPPPDTDDLLMMLIHRLTRTYLAERVKEKIRKIDPEKFKEGKHDRLGQIAEADYNDAAAPPANPRSGVSFAERTGVRRTISPKRSSPPSSTYRKTNTRRSAAHRRTDPTT